MSMKDDILERLARLPGVQCAELDELLDSAGNPYKAFLLTGHDPEGLTYTVATDEALVPKGNPFHAIAADWMRETGRAWQ